MKSWKTTLFFFTVLILGQGFCFAQQVFSDKQTQALKCAEEKIFAVYNFLNVDKPSDQKVFTPSQCGKSKPIAVPAWLEKALPEMAKKKTWQQSTESGTQSYSEAQIWQRAFGIIHEFLTLEKPPTIKSKL